MLTIEDVLLSQKNLEYLCADRNLQTKEIFFGNAFYGMDFAIKKYVNFPASYPLKSLLVHGPILSNDYIWQAEIETPLSNIYCYPSYRENTFLKAFENSQSPKFIIPAASPFLYAIEILKTDSKYNFSETNRDGTIFFPTHSSGYVTVEMDFEALAEELIRLDDKYQPVTVCLYWKDFNLGRHIPFKKRGLRIVSAGHVFDPYFLFRFYHLCSMHRYACSNDIGTHIFYSIKSGCSYFHLNSSVKFTHAAQNEALLKHDLGYVPHDRELALKSLFSIPQPQTTTPQMAMVDYYLGANNLKSKSELCQELIDAELLFRGKIKTKIISYPQKFISHQIQESKKINKITVNNLEISKNFPVVSICIPTYNGEQFILEALASAASQSYSHLEIIISDDSSCDTTLELVRKILNRTNISFRIISHKQYGLADNWNFCISQAKGKYIKLLFQDDLLEPNAIEEMVNLAEQDEEIGLVFSPRNIFTNTGDIYCNSNLLEWHEAKDVHKAWSKLQPIQLGQELLQDENIFDNPINKVGEPSTVLIRKEVFEKVGLFNPGFCQLVDLEMWLRIMSQYKVGFVDKVLSHFRIHPEQQTRRNTALKDAIFLDYQKLFHTIYSDTRYPQLTRQQAFYRYAALSEQDVDLRKSRTQIAEQWLSIPDNQLEDMYQGMLGKTHKMLLNSSLKYTKFTDDERIFVNELTLRISQGLEQPKATQYLLAVMLYCRADQLSLHHDVSLIPDWLFKDYLQFIFSSPAHFNECGEAENYYHYIQKSLEYLHASIFSNLDSLRSQEFVNNFAQRSNLIPAYFNENNLQDIYIKRAGIIEYFLKINGCEIDCEFPERPANRKKIRLGILAAHFTPGSETFAYLPVYEYLSREFEVILYSLNQTGHSLEQYCQSCANSFKALPNDLATQVNIIRADELDILFVATNVTAVTNQICVLATHRLARIQVTSGGSVVTTGMRHMDYYISGTLTDPSPNAQEQYREKLVKLEGTAHCFSYGYEQEKATVKVERESLSISEEVVVFISGANFFKITSELIHTWAKIIAEVQNSVLVLLPFGPNWSNTYPKKAFESSLSEVLAQYGVSADRLIILDPQPVPNREDVKEYLQVADVYLDSYPFAGTTSLIEPLQVNLPVIARQGNSFRSAMGAAMIQTLDIPDLVADSEESYIDLAVSLGTNPELRQQKSQQIKEKMQNNPAFLDSRSYSAKIGNLFQELFSNYQKNALSENLRLRDNNLIVFPDWNQSEESVGLELQEVIKTLANHGDSQKTTLLIDTSNIAVEEAEMFLSSVAMNLMMEEDLDMTEDLEISLVAELSDMQWEALFPHIQARIVLECENQAAVAKLPVEKLPQCEIEGFQLSVG